MRITEPFIVRRGLATAALAAGLLGGMLGLPASAPAAPVAAVAADPGDCGFNEECIYKFYTDATKSVEAGTGVRYCDGTYEQLEGSETAYYKRSVLECPY